MTASQVKILVSVFLALALWRIFELPGVATAFWAFITVGAIPGTNDILGTETMLRILFITFAVSVFLIFRKEFMASLPRRTVKPVGAATAPIAPAAKPETTVTNSHVSTRQQIIITLTAQPDQRTPEAVRPFIVILGRAAAWIIQLTCWMEAFCRRATRVVIATAKRAYSFGAIHTRRFIRTSYRVLSATGRYIQYALIIAWKMAEPHIRNFDGWLDRQLHANKYTADALQFMSDVAKGATESYRRAEQATHKLRENK